MRDLHDTTKRADRLQCEIREELGNATLRAYFRFVTPTNEQLVALGMQWAMHRPEGDQRDVPSRRTAFELASKALGRRASSEESIVVQRAARAAASSLPATDARPRPRV